MAAGRGPRQLLAGGESGHRGCSAAGGGSRSGSDLRLTACGGWSAGSGCGLTLSGAESEQAAGAPPFAHSATPPMMESQGDAVRVPRGRWRARPERCPGLAAFTIRPFVNNGRPCPAQTCAHGRQSSGGAETVRGQRGWPFAPQARGVTPSTWRLGKGRSLSAATLCACSSREGLCARFPTRTAPHRPRQPPSRRRLPVSEGNWLQAASSRLLC